MILSFRRNSSSMDFTYNCGGYALETYNWYLPYDDPDEFYMGYYKTQEQEERLLTRFTEYILNDFPGKIRVIEDEAKVLPDEYLVALRIGPHDFHFLKNSKRHWEGKMGSNPKIFHYTYEEVYASHWENEYVSRIVLFAKKRR